MARNGRADSAIRRAGAAVISPLRSGAPAPVLNGHDRAGTYDWQFIPVAGDTFSDSGTGTCH